MTLIFGLFLLLPANAKPNGLVLGNRVRVTKIVVGTERRRSWIVDRLTFGITERKDPDFVARRSLIGHTIAALVKKLQTDDVPAGLPEAHLHLTLVDRDFNEIPTRRKGEPGDHYFLGYEVRMRLVFPRWFRPGLRSPHATLAFFGTRHLGDPEFRGAYLAQIDGETLAGDASGAIDRFFEQKILSDSSCGKRLQAPPRFGTAK